MTKGSSDVGRVAVVDLFVIRLALLDMADDDEVVRVVAPT